MQEKEKDAGDVELDQEDEFSLMKKKKPKSKKIRINDTPEILGAEGRDHYSRKLHV